MNKDKNVTTSAFNGWEVQSGTLGRLSGSRLFRSRRFLFLVEDQPGKFCRPFLNVTFLTKKRIL